MSSPFRDDHDAALARVDALEAENRELRERLASQPAPELPAPARFDVGVSDAPPPVHRRHHYTGEAAELSRGAIAVCAIVIVVVVMGALQLGTRRRVSSADSVHATTARLERIMMDQMFAQPAERSLLGCIDVAPKLDREVDWSDRISVGLAAPSEWEQFCAPLVAEAAADGERLSPASRAILDAWARAEHELAAVRRRVWKSAALATPDLVVGIAAARAVRTDVVARLPAVRDEWLNGPDPDPGLVIDPR